MSVFVDNRKLYIKTAFPVGDGIINAGNLLANRYFEP